MAEDLIYYYHPDHLGTATYLTDINGLPYEFFLNLPFGETMAEQHSQTADYVNRWKFTGHELDRETGLYYANARYYDPKVSIFISVDPLAEQAPDWTPYRYGFNNPIRYTDPTGMYENDDHYFNENGQYLYSDTRTSDNIRVISNQDWNNISANYESEIKDSKHSYVNLLNELDSKSRIVTEENSGSKFASMWSSPVERIGYPVLNFDKATLTFEVDPLSPSATATEAPIKYKAGERHHTGGIVLGNAHTHPTEHTYLGKTTIGGITVTDSFNFNHQYSVPSGDGHTATKNGPTYTISKFNIDYYSPKGKSFSTNNISTRSSLESNQFNLNRNALFKYNGR